MRIKLILILLAMLCHGIIISQQTPSKLVLKDGKPYSGFAVFKFAIVSEGMTLWSNDLSSGRGEEPLSGLSVYVDEGIFNLELGGEGMAPIYPDLLQMFPDKNLMIWIDNGEGFSFIDMLAITDDQVEIVDETFEGAPLLESATGNDEKIKDTREKGMDGAQHPDRYFEYRMIQKGADKKSVPMDALLKAKAHIERMPPLRDAGIWVWQWLGPSNIGGRIRAIAIREDNTNVIVVGGVSGGIWRSTNAGASWAAVNDFLPSLAVTSIVIDPNNNAIMYAATGEGFWNHDCLPGAGIFKSTDGGATWSQLASTNNNDFRWVNRLARHPDSSQVLFAVTGNGKVFKTTNGGTTWVNRYTCTEEATDVDIHPNLPQYVIVGSGNNAYLSSNYGNSFTRLTTGAVNKLPSNPGRCEVTFCPSNNGRFYVSMNRNKGEIWRSDDYGAIWSRKCTGDQYLGGQGWYNNIIWINPSNSLQLVVGGIDLWRSTDGGVNLTRISDWTKYHNNSSANSAHADQHMIIHPANYNATTNPRVYVGNDGGIQTTANIWTATTTSWSNLAGTSLGITQFFGGAAYPDGSVIVGGTQDNDHLRYKSSGTWSGANNWFQAETGDGGCAAIKPTNSNIIYSEYTNLVIEKSTDGGATYPVATSGLGDAGTDWALFISPFVMDPNNSSRLIAGGQSIWRTTNEAGSWSRIRDSVATDNYPKCSAIDIAQGNSDIIWVGYETGQVAKTTNGTAAAPTWTRVDNNGTTPLPNRFVTDIAINPFNHNEVWVTFGGNNSDCVWRTTNGGTSWEERTGTAPNDMPAIQCNTIRVHPNNQNWIYVGTDLGLLASEDKGATWSVLPRYPGVGHEGPVNTEVSEIFWQGEFLIAATHGRGMYRAAPLSTIYVDLNAAAGGNGTYAAPYQTVTQAVNNQGPGSNISISAGSYNETGTVLFSRKCYVSITNGTGIVIIY